MSFAVESWAWDQRCGDGVAKSVLAYLSFLANRKTGEAWPSMETIIWAVEHGERAVRKAVAKLVKTGKVEREQRFAPNGRCTSTLYRLPVVAAPAEEPECAAPAAAAPDPAPTPANSQETHPCQSAGVILEPSKNEPRKEERASSASPPTPPADPPPQVQSSPKQAPRVVTAAPSRRTPLPDGWQPDPDVRQAALDDGINPNDILDELHDWWLRNPDKPQGDWNATFRGFVRQAKRGRATVGAKRDWRAENAAFIAETDQILHVPDGWTYVGVAP